MSTGLVQTVREIRLQDWILGGKNPFFLISGPCVIESEQHCHRLAEQLKQITTELKIPFIFKASFDKANRTSIHSYRGPGIEDGLRILRDIKRDFQIPVTSDIHSTEQVEPAGEVLDIIQIPAFLCRQTDLLISAAGTGKIINVKKGQFLAPWDVRNIIGKVDSAGNRNLIITERGSSFGYNNLVVDFKSLPIIRSFGCPVVFDATHSVQLPGGKGDASSGQAEHIPFLAAAAAAVGVDGFFFEVHDQPDQALSDGPNSLPIEEVPRLLMKLRELDRIAKSR
jgi:2-dehydro-3-deoxyphosphooctonate aldolase (KDO 8-P synthase)